VNPELLRNLWLEFSIRRLIVMPAILGLIFAAPLIREPIHEAERVRGLLLPAAVNTEYPLSRLSNSKSLSPPILQT
jgi:hypothetical protein